MLSALPILAVLLVPAAILVAVMVAVEARQRARADVAARQIMLTDAVHAELGAIVSPVVEKHAFRPWRVVFALPEGRVRDDMARLMAITDRVLGARLTSSDELQIVFTRSSQAPRAAAA
jgi:hypothetical protein